MSDGKKAHALRTDRYELYVRKSHPGIRNKAYIVVYGWSVGELTDRVDYIIKEYNFFPIGGIATLTLKVNVSDRDGGITFTLPDGKEASADGVLFQAMMPMGEDDD